MLIDKTIIRGKILGLEEYGKFEVTNPFGEASPFRFLASAKDGPCFVVINPFVILDDYTIDVDETVMSRLGVNGNYAERVAVMCIMRVDEDRPCVNLRSPLVINTETGAFEQVILQNDTYGVSVPFEPVGDGK